MRTLGPAPTSFYDESGAPRFGSYAGALPPVDLERLAKSKLDLVTKRKRWIYVSLANERFFVGAAAVHVGYAATLFAFVFDRDEGMLFDGSTLALPVGQRFGVPPEIEFRGPSALVSITREAMTLKLDALNVVAELEMASAPQPIGAIAKVAGGVVNATEKRAPIVARRARVQLGQREIDLGPAALAGYDYTHGLLARKTAWKWAWLLGRAKGGEKIAMNLVEGFVGEPECAVWVDDQLYPVGEGRFTFDPKRPLEPWRVKTACGAVDLAFSPGGMHAEDKNFGVIRSHFVQPVGRYNGTITIPGRAPLEIVDVLGVTEDQDVLW